MSDGQAMTYTRFHVVEEGDRIIGATALPVERTPRWAKNVPPRKHAWPAVSQEAVWMGPLPFVIPPAADSGEPFYAHNHCPAITWCDNGDLLAIWFSTDKEVATDMTILASRLRPGAAQWGPAAEFFKGEARNMTGSALLRDEAGRLHHINGVGPQGVKGWRALAMLMRTSADHGVTWTPPRPISTGDRYLPRHQVIAGASITPQGDWLLACDGTHRSEGPSALHLSADGGRTWRDAGGDIRGIHAGVVGLSDGQLLALGRAQALDGQMPLSRSIDRGRSWTSQPSPFPPISTGQRLVLMRLHEGPLLLISFTDPDEALKDESATGMPFTDAAGRTFHGRGMFAAVSFDEGESWPVRKLLTPGEGEYDGGAWTGPFTASPTQAEPKGYLAATQTPDGLVHLLSSRLHYRFNLAWLQQPLP